MRVIIVMSPPQPILLVYQVALKYFEWSLSYGLKTKNGDIKGGIIVRQEGQDGPVSLTWLPDKFESTGLAVPEKKFNIDFHDGTHLGFPIGMI